VDSKYLLILEYADSGTLRNYLKNNFNKLDWNIKLQFAIQIANAVTYIHQRNIVHRDLVCILSNLVLNRISHILNY
jgi:serine/threonine protein kinase